MSKLGARREWLVTASPTSPVLGEDEWYEPNTGIVDKRLTNAAVVEQADPEATRTIHLVALLSPELNGIAFPLVSKRNDFVPNNVGIKWV